MFKRISKVFGKPYDELTKAEKKEEDQFVKDNKVEARASEMDAALGFKKVDSGWGPKKRVAKVDEVIKEPKGFATWNPCMTHAYGDYKEDGTCHGSYLGEIRALVENKRIEAEKEAEKAPKDEAEVKLTWWGDNYLDYVESHPFVDFKRSVVALDRWEVDAAKSVMEELKAWDPNKKVKKGDFNFPPTTNMLLSARDEYSKVFLAFLKLLDHSRIPLEEVIELTLHKLKGGHAWNSPADRDDPPSVTLKAGETKKKKKDAKK